MREWILNLWTSESAIRALLVSVGVALTDADVLGEYGWIAIVLVALGSGVTAGATRRQVSAMTPQRRQRRQGEPDGISFERRN
jgi:hypothetical protein